MIENNVDPVTMMLVYITKLYCFDCMSMVNKGVSRVYLYTFPGIVSLLKELRKM